MRHFVPALFVLASEATYLTFTQVGDLRRHPRLLVSGLALLVAAYLLMLARLSRGRVGRREARLLLAAAVLFRLTLLPTTPSLSDDIYRYLWDGKVLLSGHNPYSSAPADETLADLRDPYWPLINYPELPTIYPPAAQLLFAAGALGGPFRLLTTKLLILLAEAGLVLGLHQLLRGQGRDPRRLLIYLLHPLPILELAHAGHLEALPVAGLVWAVVALNRGWARAGGGALAFSILGKFFSLCLIPQALRALGRRGAAVLAGALLLAYLPFLSAGSNLYRSLWEYGSRWRWYDSGFAVLDRAAATLGLGNALHSLIATLDHQLYGRPGRELVRSLYPLAQDHMVARAASLVLFAGILWWCHRRRLPLSQTALVAAAAFCFLTPSLHPWYLEWLLPWLVIHRSWGLLALTLGVPFSYATFLYGPAPTGSWPEPTAIKWATFLLAAGLLVAQWRSRSRPAPDQLETGRG